MDKGIIGNIRLRSLWWKVLTCNPKMEKRITIKTKSDSNNLTKNYIQKVSEQT